MFGTLLVHSSAFGQTAGPSNPNENVTTAYKILNQTNNSTLTIQTDLPSYKLGNTIVLTGHITNLQSSSAITIRVFNPSQNLISVSQILPSSDGSFTKTILTVLPLWSESGTYTIVTQYGKYIQTSTTFSYIGQSSSSITVTTDKPSYSYGNTILISGKVQGDILQNVPMSIRIVTPSGNLVIADQLSVGSDGTFSRTISSSGSSWSDAGTYQIVVQYGSSDRTSQTTFQFSGTNTSPTPTPQPTPSSSTTISTPSKIPNWVKGVFSFYAQGNLSDDDLIKALQFLIQQGIIKVN